LDRPRLVGLTLVGGITAGAFDAGYKCIQTGGQLVRRHGPQDIVIRTRSQSLDAPLLRGITAEKDKRHDTAGEHPHALQKGKTIHVRQASIRDNEVRPAAAQIG